MGDLPFKEKTQVQFHAGKKRAARTWIAFLALTVAENTHTHMHGNQQRDTMDTHCFCLSLEGNTFLYRWWVRKIKAEHSRNMSGIPVHS